MKHKATALLCAACLAFTGAAAAMPAPAAVSAASIGGECGKNLSWEFDGYTGTLTISGTGAMDQFLKDDCPWLSVRDSITKLDLESGLTKLGQDAFYALTNLTSVVIPDTVTDLGNCAFENCTKLEKIVFPKGLKSIGPCTFEGCTSLKSVTIPDTIETLESDAFAKCTGLTSVTLPNSLTTIGIGAFIHCTALKSVTFPNHLEAIRSYAFCDCTGLTKITIPDTVTEIGKQAFSGCEKLTDVTIPGSVSYIGFDSFLLTPWLTKQAEKNPLVVINDCIVSTTNCRGRVIVPEGVTEIPDYAFHRKPYLTEIILPTTCSVIGNDALSGCPELKKVVIQNAKAQILTGYAKTTDDVKGNTSVHWAITNHPVETKIIRNEEANSYYDLITNYPAFSGTIYGRSGSTAEEFAKNYCDFAVIDTRGDVNMDWSITADDAQLALMAYLSHLSSSKWGLTVQQYRRANVNEDETLNADDAQCILMYAVKELAGLRPEWNDIIK